MRKSILGIFLSVPLAITSIVACSSDGDDSGSSAGSGGTSGAHSAGAAGTHSAGSGQGGGTVDMAGTGNESAGSAGDAGAAGSGTVLVPPTPPQAAVYTMSNAADANQVFGFLRAADGSLSPMAAPFATGGKGSAAALGEQGALAFDLAQKRIYAVNAGDNSFSVFAVNDDGSLGTALNVTTAAFGTTAATLLGPKSITFHGNTVYVLYEGTGTSPSMIAGWTVAASGTTFTATAIAGSALPLSSATQGVDPAQIELTPDGDWLVVSEKQSGAAGAVAGAGALDTFAVSATGLASLKASYKTAKVGTTDAYQMTPFGFEFEGNYLIVSEAGSTGVGAYTYAGGVITPVATAQFLPTDPAPCWVAFSGNHAYVANARGPSISGFNVDESGGLSNIGPIANGIVASTGTVDAAHTTFQGPTDEFLSADGKYLYVINSAVPSIGAFTVQANGTLERVGATDYSPPLSALPKGVAGIVAR
jgi:6-phosphogluconolactonase (cycloisomerase 2 family)